MTAAREAGVLAPSAEAGAPESIRPAPGLPLLLLVGNPNVGKTSLFNRLARRNERGELVTPVGFEPTRPVGRGF